MDKHQKSAQKGTHSGNSRLLCRRKNSLSSAKLCGYNGRSFEETMRNFWKNVAGFSCEWCEGWDKNPKPDYTFSKDEKAVTFVTHVKTDTEELETGRLYMVYNTAQNRLTAVGFTDQNDGYTQEYTEREIQNALKTVFDEHN